MIKNLRKRVNGKNNYKEILIKHIDAIKNYFYFLYYII